MSVVGQCALCGLTKELRESHIIPDFVGKWLKDTSATGYLRQAVNPNKRIQDIFKIHLLCNDCEVLFSKYEKAFSENIFSPFQKGEKAFHYDEWFLKYIISISWRVGVLELNKQQSIIPLKLIEELRVAVDIWKDYLLGNRKNVGSYESHVFFLDILESVSPGGKVLENMNWYFLRAIDATVAYSSI